MNTQPAAQTLLIDGQTVPYRSGQTVLQAALAAGLPIPHLCYHPELEPIGSCRLCLVEVDGRPASACTLPAALGQIIQSTSPNLQKRRRALLEMLVEQGRHACNWCERSGDCRLQEAAAGHAILAFNTRPGLAMPVRDDSHPQVALDRARCILCGICVQASRDLDGKGVFSFESSGADMRLAVDSDSGLLADSDIAAEDHAVRLCPVGALVKKSAPAQGFSSFDFFDAGDWGG